MVDPDRSLIGRIAAHERWARTSDRVAATEAARRGQDARWLRMAREECGDLPEAELAYRAEHLRRAHMIRIARLSAARRRKIN